ncbi:PBP1A family penicillin-binding protein [Cytobacillus spongiae]|uniref:transglycosylase domain-containing protein n=1 Tax=Cytobacillus spongiae TaxID=2901381 RepID=UPI001F4383A8|nr:PBP1A family penicillin-binding protein [Cytobacillus spongiae]UII57920.1 PBP1A family penicillin-binding protein [Cytobacillus spongiae]
MERIKELIKPVFNFSKRLWKKYHITQAILLIGLTFVLITILFFAFMASQANVKSLKDGLRQSTIIIDKDGDVATEITTDRTVEIDIDSLPTYMGDAVVAIEDERFYEHNGFDLKGITRAFFKNLFAGRITGGGSTITQQLTKNALLSPERSYKRKVEELFLAVEIEDHYKKDEILQMYLNQVYFGNGAWGINQAAKKYFNKSMEQITISEAALLAGLLQAPSALNPYSNYDAAINRRNVVLGKMKEHHMISPEEYQIAIEENIPLKDGGGNSIKRDYPYYVDAVLDEAITKYGLTQEEILTRGYRIFTEMDQNLQSVMENVYENDWLFPRGKNGTLVQSGAVLLDPASGGARALIGGRGDYVFRGFNRATHIKAQPGSTIKPLAVYTPSLEEGYLVTSELQDQLKSYGDYTPENYSKTYSGVVPMYKAVEQSLNAPAVWLLDEMGMNKGLDALKRFGIPLEEDDNHLGIALGGMKRGVSPMELAEAYATFPNQGKKVDSHLITKIVGPTGNIIAERKKKVSRVTTKSVSNNMTSMLLNVVESGTGKGTQIPGIEIAGKTGSTQLPYSDLNGTKDQWFVGYTPNLVGAVWVGYDQTDREHYLSTSSSETVVPIFKALFEATLPYMEHDPFDVPSVNAKLSGTDNKKPILTEKAVKEKAEEFEKMIQEEAPKWKEKLESTFEKMKELEDQLKDKIDEWLNN